jgi:hypothetical protein
VRDSATAGENVGRDGRGKIPNEMLKYFMPIIPEACNASKPGLIFNGPVFHSQF